MEQTQKLHIFYDNRCRFCVRVMSYIQREEKLIPLEFHCMWAAKTLDSFPGLGKYFRAGRFVVMGDGGALYLDTRARLMILYALKRYRGLAADMSHPESYWLVDKVFESISSSRGFISNFLDKRKTAELNFKLCNAEVCGTTKEAKA